MLNDSSFALGLVAVIIMGILVAIFMPFLIIWSLNTLFGLTITYSLKTWFATLVLGGILGGKSGIKFDKKN